MYERTIESGQIPIRISADESQWNFILTLLTFFTLDFNCVANKNEFHIKNIYILSDKILFDEMIMQNL